MKVNDVLRKFWRMGSSVPVILTDINDYKTKREAWGQDFNNGYYPEKDRTVHCFEALTDKFVIYYK